MIKNKVIYKIWLKPLAIVLVCLFGFNSISFADGNSLSIWTAMERPEVKREAMATMYRQGRLIWIAQSDKYLNLLKNYNALALLLPSGRYLMAPETANNSLSLIRAATHEDYEVLMQREEELHKTRYQRVMNYELLMRQYLSITLRPMNLSIMCRRMMYMPAERRRYVCLDAWCHAPRCHPARLNI